MARHKPPAGPFDIKLGPGGLVDLEFAVHTLQLTHRIGLDPRLEVALAALVEAGLIDAGDRSGLAACSAGCWSCCGWSRPRAMEPAEQSQALVAARAGMQDWPSLLAAHDAARQRIAARWAAVKGSE